MIGLDSAVALGLAFIPTLGMAELLVILLIIVVIFGASKLPQLGRGLGEGISNFKKGLKDSDREGLDESPGPSGDTKS